MKIEEHRPLVVMLTCCFCSVLFHSILFHHSPLRSVGALQPIASSSPSSQCNCNPKREQQQPFHQNQLASRDLLWCHRRRRRREESLALRCRIWRLFALEVLEIFGCVVALSSWCKRVAQACWPTSNRLLIIWFFYVSSLSLLLSHSVSSSC